MTNWTQRINEKLEAHFSEQNWPSQQLLKAMHYAVCNGGKRSRAKLCYLIGTGLKLSPENIDPIAMAIECLHAYTLVHDDLPAMDDDDWRRHQPSCHKAFDEATAILAGDALQAHAFRLLCEGNDIKQIRFFADTAGAPGLCSGQSLDMLHKANSSLATIQQIHHLKTGVLLGAACRLPGMAANRQDHELDLLQRFGEQLGLLLQINDDLIDNNKGIGKTVGKDQKQNKASLSNVDQALAKKAVNEAIRSCEHTLAQILFLPADTKKELAHHVLCTDPFLPG